MKEEYEYGTPIPIGYRNRLFDWEGGGYSGCFFERNQGMVDAEGHWHPLFSTGRAGIDDCGWYEKKIQQLKAELGYDVRHPKVQFDDAHLKAVKQVFGPEWYMLPNDGTGAGLFDDPRVLELIKKDKERYEEFCKRRDQYKEERTHRLDWAFMQAFDREDENERPDEIGLLDPAHIKETCKAFCDAYKGNVGMMTNVLDKLEDMGYSVWCTCSDCGNQWQRENFESYSCYVDNDAYHGDGGIGVIMTRVMCDSCMDMTNCPACGDNNLPNLDKPDKGEQDYEMYDLLASVIHAWIGVCWCCADGYKRDILEGYSEAHHMWMWKSEAGVKFGAIEEALEKHYDMSGHKLYEEMEKTIAGRKKINEIRDLLQESLKDYFDDKLDCDWYDDRLDVSVSKQTELELQGG